MMRDVRLQQMERAVLEAGTMSMDELCERFDVSINTIRRDVAELKRRGVLEKVYGGVTAVEGSRALRPFVERAGVSVDAKERIGRAAAALVQDNDVIYIDSGTTVPHMVQYLQDKVGMTVITNNLEVVERALEYENISVIVLPGRLHRRTNSLAGVETTAALRNYNIHKAFMATTGTTAEGVTNSSPSEFEVKQAAVATIPTRIVLLTADKFGRAGLMNYADFSSFACVVTDAQPPEPYATNLRKAGVQVITAEE